MAFKDSTWTVGGQLFTQYYEAGDQREESGVCAQWRCESSLRQYRNENNELRSAPFAFVGARWNFLLSFDLRQVHSQFGINIQPQSLSNVVFDCRCRISFYNFDERIIKEINCEIKSNGADSHWAVENFLSSHELDSCLRRGSNICCHIRVEKSSIKKTCAQAEKEDEELSPASFESDVLKDLKNLLLSGEGSDVILQVQAHQFKAHRSILAARSSVFSAMLRHDMKENATRVMNVEHCEASYFPVLLEFLYCGSTEKLSNENVFSLYTSADKYDVQDVKMKCIQFIQTHLSVETFCDTARLSLQHSETNLLELTTDFFTWNLKEIILTKKWQSFIVENPIQSNEFFIKALASDVKDDDSSSRVPQPVAAGQDSLHQVPLSGPIRPEPGQQISKRLIRMYFFGDYC